MSLTITGRLGLYVALLTVLLAAGWLLVARGEDARVVADGGTEVPASPSGLGVSIEPGSLAVSVDWDDVAGADDYLVRWRPKDGQLERRCEGHIVQRRRHRGGLRPLGGAGAGLQRRRLWEPRCQAVRG